jgi:hypothetical protein
MDEETKPMRSPLVAPEGTAPRVAVPPTVTPTRVVPQGPVLVGALAVGVAADLLLRDSAGPGLNLFLLFLLLAASVMFVTRRAGARPGGEAVAWILAGLLFATTFFLRAAPTLQVLAFLAASAAFALPALRAGAGWLRQSGVSDAGEAILSALLHAATGPLRMTLQRLRVRSAGTGAGANGTEGPTNPLLSGKPPEAPAIERSVGGRSPGAPRARALALGLLLAAPLLLLFGALFMSADPVFADLVVTLFGSLNLEEMVSRLLFVGVLAWLASGYLAGFVTGTRLRGWVEPLVPRPSLGILETGTALALVNLLFAAFVLVQLRYLFGGSAMVEVTPGLTYAEYAREGFAQLVVVAGLVLPLLLAADWLLRRHAPRDVKVFRGLGGVLLLLLVVIMASAGQRVRVYQEAYGLTESRYYGAAFLVWLALVTAWFGATVLRGRREHFAAPALLSGFVLVAALVVLNPDARIARGNLAPDPHPGSALEVDAVYLGTLSADAVPVLLQALPTLAEEARCTVAAHLERRWGTGVGGGWRSWNLAEARARRLVRETSPEFLALEGCPEPPRG